MSEIQIEGKMRNVTVEGSFVKTQFDDHYNKTSLNPQDGRVVLKPSFSNWGTNIGITQFVNSDPPSTDIYQKRKKIKKYKYNSNGLFGTNSEIHPDGTYYPPELGTMVQALASYGYDISAFTQFVQTTHS